MADAPPRIREGDVDQRPGPGIQSSRSFYGRFGWNYHDTWAAGDYPTYALRTTDGGVVAWYFLDDRQTAVRTGSGRPLRGGAA